MSSIKQPFLRLLGSSKAWVMLAAIAGAVVLEQMHQISAKDALDFIKWIVGAYMGATGIEDAGKKAASTVNVSPAPAAVGKPAAQ